MISSHLHRCTVYSPGQQDTLADLRNRLSKEFGITVDADTGTITLRWGSIPSTGALRQVTMTITDIEGDQVYTICDRCGDAFGDLRPIKVETRHPAGSKSPVIGIHLEWMCADCRSPK